jgi:threonine/homoserine/homoserine lactone efflux protein
MTSITGDLIATSLIGIVASLGLVIIIEDYPIFLPTIKIIGGVYLFYIGVKTWLSHNGPIESVNNTKLLFSRIWVRSFVISISNPKAIIFFTVFFPIFISSEDNAYRIHVQYNRTLIMTIVPNIQNITADILLI